MRGANYRSSIAFVLFAALPVAAWADLPIYPIAVTGTPAPDGGTFVSFGPPTGDRETYYYVPYEPFWFTATTSTGVSGVYVYDVLANQYFTLADSNMAAPTGGSFASFSNTSSGWGELGFIATDSNGVAGAYAIGAFPLTLFATASTITSTGQAIGNLRNISVMGTGPYGAPGGEMESDTGIYGIGGTLIVGTSAVQSASAFSDFGPVSYKGNVNSNHPYGTGVTNETFRATANGIEGVYYGIDYSSAPQALCTAGSGLPDANGNPNPALGIFTSFGDPIGTSSEVTFTAHYTFAGQDQQGVFSYGPYDDPTDSQYGLTKLRQLVATGDMAPDSGGATFTGFPVLGADETFVAILSDGNEGLYEAFGPLEDLKVLETGDILDGKIVAELGVAQDASGEAGTAFEVDFTDGSQGMYYFDVPEPEPIALLGFPLLVSFRRRRCHARALTQDQDGRDDSRVKSFRPDPRKGLPRFEFVNESQ